MSMHVNSQAEIELPPGVLQEKSKNKKMKTQICKMNFMNLMEVKWLIGGEFKYPTYYLS